MKRRRHKKRTSLMYKNTEYHSELEILILKQIEKTQRKTKISYETERLPYTLRRYYVPDFVCRRADGTTFYIEVKGYLRPSDRTKLLAVKEAFPEIDLKLVFAKDNKLNSKSKTRYTECAMKSGFDYAVGNVPKGWFKNKNGNTIPSVFD